MQVILRILQFVKNGLYIKNKNAIVILQACEGDTL